MDERKTFGRDLDLIEQAMKELEIAYEQYFLGSDKHRREPIKDREALAKQLRRFANRRIMQTDLRFRYQNLATRFHSYQGYWDRILRLMDEGKYVRQLHKTASFATPSSDKTAPPPPPMPTEADLLFEQLAAAHRACRLEQQVPDRRQVAAFLDTQKERIRERFGDRAVEFVVVTEEGKPKIKVRPKQ